MSSAFQWPPANRKHQPPNRHNWQGGIVCQLFGLERRKILRERDHYGPTACLLVDVAQYKIHGEWIELERLPKCDAATARRNTFTRVK